MSIISPHVHTDSRARLVTLLRVATAVLAAAPLALALRPASALVHFPLTEDGYYLLSVSRHIAMGHGITADGRLWTNGVQPLFAFLLVPVYWVAGGDRVASLRGVLALHWAFHVSTALVLGSLVAAAMGVLDAKRRRAAFWLTAFLWMGSRFVLLGSYNGLETGCALLLYAAAWRAYQADWLDGARLWALGVVLGLLVLARIDAAVFVAVLSVSELARRGVPATRRLLRAAVLALVPFAISLPWWLYNVLGFGSLLPTSGAAQTSAFHLERVGPFAGALLQAAVPYLQVRWIDGPLQWFLQAAILAAVAWTVSRTALPGLRRDLVVRGGTLLLLGAAVLGAWYLAFFRATHFYGRYLAPVMLPAVATTSVAVLRARRTSGTLVLVVLLGVGPLALASVGGWVFQVGVARNPFYDHQLALIEEHVPAGETVAAFQSGTIGYFRDGVVNLDGKVNVEAQREQERQNLRGYLVRRGVRWYCDQGTGFYDERADEWTVVARQGGFVLCRRAP